jgi:hypothetical protein
VGEGRVDLRVADPGFLSGGSAGTAHPQKDE